MNKRILICGDRNWTDEATIGAVLVQHLDPTSDYVIHGCARGADTIGGDIAKALGVPKTRILKFPADWNKYRKAAGPIRNQQMITEGKPTLVLAFHNHIIMSKGTKDMIRKALKAGLPVYLNGKKLPSTIANNTFW
jgi:hypothetical protein